MRFDMHCHIKNGSLDSRVAIDDYIRLLKAQGFHGMLITDHNTYRGYRNYLKRYVQPDFEHKDFVVLRGIEYDTLDAGHMLIIMPDHVNLKLLEIRGMRLKRLIELVHRHGGIIGPAHPYGAKFLSAMPTRKLAKHPELIEQFDFIEAFNTCEHPDSNHNARLLASQNQKIGFAGSDSHKDCYVGMAYTDIDYPVKNCSDLIHAVHENRVTGFGGTERIWREKSAHRKQVILNPLFRIYNYTLSGLHFYTRIRHYHRNMVFK